MISSEEATQIIHNHLFLSKPVAVKLLKILGRTLREDIMADRDLPPFDRVTMDGIAIDYQAFADGRTTFEVECTQFAGKPQLLLASKEACIEVMTGAMLPIGTDTVIRYEDLEREEREKSLFFTLKTDKIKKGQNIHYQGNDCKQAEVLVKAGVKISPVEINVAAAVGKSHLMVSQKPLFAIVSNGDELIDIESEPLTYQIRRSNTYLLLAALEKLRIKADSFHLPDKQAIIEAKLAKMLDPASVFDVILLTGGVSAGKADFIPTTLANLGVKKLFHQVAQRPGKPFWFGRTEAGKTVFALPGNPVSTFICFHKYVVPWLKASLLEADALALPKAMLEKDVTFLPKLTYFLQVKTYLNENQQLVATPLEGGGSGDFANLLECDGFLELPAERTEFKAGEMFNFIQYR
ncbi:MAG: molybdopterin molybdenumtransferase MoeA [Cytophagales bacterium]|nr:MAG: molybdopterin molybdenumtransferase MoeA [Cytophagales bacterium]